MRDKSWACTIEVRERRGILSGHKEICRDRGQRHQGTLCLDRTFPCHDKEMCRLWKLGRDKEFHVVTKLSHGRRFPCHALIF